MASGETITLVTELTSEEVTTGWPASTGTDITNVYRVGEGVSCLLTEVGTDSATLVEALFSGFPSVDRVAWTQGSNTDDSCRIKVYERAPDLDEPGAFDMVLEVTSGMNHWRLARDAVRAQCGIPVVTYHEILGSEADVQARYEGESGE